MKIKLDPGAIMPNRAHATDAGLDLMSPGYCLVPAHGSAVIATGVHVELPAGTVGMLKSKSGLNVKHNITSEGVIDEGYIGGVVVKLRNHGSVDYEVMPGDKISQLVILPCLKPELEPVDELTDSERGAGGFGSTGR